jgi:hypothetical protein
MSSLMKFRIIDHELCVCEYGLRAQAVIGMKTCLNIVAANDILALVRRSGPFGPCPARSFHGTSKPNMKNPILVFIILFYFISGSIFDLKASHKPIPHPHVAYIQYSIYVRYPCYTPTSKAKLYCDWPDFL